jgi:hypothetical protein
MYFSCIFSKCDTSGSHVIECPDFGLLGCDVVYLVDITNVEEELVAFIFHIDYCYSYALRCRQQGLRNFGTHLPNLRALNLTKAEYEVFSK